MARLNPYLTFNGNCRDAMNFYKDCLGGELDVMLVGDSPMANQMPPSMKEQVLHSLLKKDELEIMATDMRPEALNEGNSVHLCLVFKTEDELKDLWDKLSAGGKVNQPISKMFFGLIGTFEDKFGKRWILECELPAEK
jgi:PhnB protein